MPQKNVGKINALSAAFEVVNTMDDFLGNVIASGQPTKEDLDLKKKCQKYIRWYKKHNQLKPNN